MLLQKALFGLKSNEKKPPNPNAFAGDRQKNENSSEVPNLNNEYKCHLSSQKVPPNPEKERHERKFQNHNLHRNIQRQYSLNNNYRNKSNFHSSKYSCQSRQNTSYRTFGSTNDAHYHAKVKHKNYIHDTCRSNSGKQNTPAHKNMGRSMQGSDKLSLTDSETNECQKSISHQEQDIQALTEQQCLEYVNNSGNLLETVQQSGDWFKTEQSFESCTKTKHDSNDECPGFSFSHQEEISCIKAHSQCENNYEPFCDNFNSTNNYPVSVDESTFNAIKLQNSRSKCDDLTEPSSYAEVQPSNINAEINTDQSYITNQKSVGSQIYTINPFLPYRISQAKALPSANELQQITSVCVNDNIVINQDKALHKIFADDSADQMHHGEKSVKASTEIVSTYEEIGLDSSSWEISENSLQDYELKENEERTYEMVNGIQVTSICEDDSHFSCDLIEQNQKVAIEKLLESQIEERKLYFRDKLDAITVAKILNNHLIDMKGFKAALYGSMQNGCALKGSTADITIINNGMLNFDPLEAVYSILKTRPDKFSNVAKDLENGREVTCNYRNIIVKITKNRTLELQSSQWISCYMKLDERVRVLALAFRCWGEVCADDDGMFHSSCYPLMVIHYLQQEQPPVLPVIQEKYPYIKKYYELKNIYWKSENRMSIAQLWIMLFYFYAYEFDWEKNVVTIKQSKTLTKQEKSWKQHLVAIEDPFSVKKSIAKDIVSSQVFSYIQQCFKKTHEYFMYPLFPKKSVCVDGSKDDIWSSVDDDDENEEIAYEFKAFWFNGGKFAPTYCTICENSGHPAEECPSSVPVHIESLPEMTDSFSRELDKVCEQVREVAEISENEMNERLNIVSKLQRYLKQHYREDLNVELFGSSNNGFGLPDSDLDISVVFEESNYEGNKYENSLMNLKKIAQVLRNSGEFKIRFPVLIARVPIVKFLHLPSRKKGDICISNTLAVHNTRLLRTYAQIDCRARILGYCVKVFVKHCKLDVCSASSLSSYGYILMVIHFLQQQQPPVLPVLQELFDSQEGRVEHIFQNFNVGFYDNLEELHNIWPYYQTNTKTVGQLWIEFLDYCVEKFRSSEYVVSIRQEKPLRSSEKNWISQLVCIEDPFNLEHNIGSKVAQSMAVKINKAFINGRQFFGTPIPHMPKGYKDFRDYLFDPRILSKGQIIKDYRCFFCGLIGHKGIHCPKKRL